MSAYYYHYYYYFVQVALFQFLLHKNLAVHFRSQILPSPENFMITDVINTRSVKYSLDYEFINHAVICANYNRPMCFLQVVTDNNKEYRHLMEQVVIKRRFSTRCRKTTLQWNPEKIIYRKSSTFLITCWKLQLVGSRVGCIARKSVL